MIFGITITVLTIVAIGFAFVPALFTERGKESASDFAEFEHDLTVYKDQLKELELETERGLISTADAKQAHAEIARRLLATQEKLNAIAKSGNHDASRKFGNLFIGAIALIFVPVIAALTYATLGSPTMEAQPLQARLEAVQVADRAKAQESEQLRALVARAEAHLQSNPEDGRGWDVLAPIYFRLGEGEKARNAYATAIRILGEDATRLAGLGEVEVAMAGGTVSPVAKSLFENAALLDPNDARSQFFIGLSEAQAGNATQASRIWQAITQNPDADQGWRSVAERQLAALAQIESQTSSSAPSISQETMDEAQAMESEDRQAMIQGMVSQLDARLVEQGGSVEEWQRLIRARVVLDQKEDAILAVQRALVAFEDDQQKAESIKAFATELNLSVGEAETQ